MCSVATLVVGVLERPADSSPFSLGLMITGSLQLFLDSEVKNGISAKLSFGPERQAYRMRRK